MYTLSIHWYMHSFNMTEDENQLLGRDAVAMVSNVLQQGKLEATSWNEGSNQAAYSYPCKAVHLVHLVTLTF